MLCQNRKMRADKLKEYRLFVAVRVASMLKIENLMSPICKVKKASVIQGRQSRRQKDGDLAVFKLPPLEGLTGLW